jgi:RND family efflux transporter MFP subunit
MNSRIIFPLCSVLALTLSAGCGEQQAAQSPKGRPPSPVRVATVANQEVQRSVTLVGTVEPWKRSVVASEIAGLVVQFLVEEGMAVKRGQVLAALRTDTLKIRLNSAFASHREAQTRYEQAGKDLVRAKALFDKELVTQKEYDDAIAEEAAWRQRLTQLKTVINQVRDELAKSRIVAPFDGWITKEFTEVGQWVEGGGSVVELVDLSRLQVEVPLPERYVRDVRVNDPVNVVFDGLPGFETKGRVFSLIAQADLSARTFPIKVEIPNRESSIKSGMVSRVTLSVGSPYQALVVPKDALVLRGGQQFVFLVQEGKVNQVPVTPILHLKEVVEVAGDLKPGMTVVVEGNERLLPGQPIRILESAG